MTAAWPTYINSIALVDGYSEEPQTNVVEFKPDIGPSKSRRRSSLANDIVNFEQIYSADEYDDLLNFFRRTLADGSLPFTMVHPRTLQTATWRFVTPLKISEFIPNSEYRVQFSLRLLDMTQLYRLVDYDYATLVDSDGAKLTTA